MKKTLLSCSTKILAYNFKITIEISVSFIGLILVLTHGGHTHVQKHKTIFSSSVFRMCVMSQF